VVHGLLGAFTWGLVGWPAFLFMMLVLGLVVLLLMTYDAEEGPAAREPEDSKPGNGGSPVSPGPAPTTP
jgi:hypothetical protein